MFAISATGFASRSRTITTFATLLLLTSCSQDESNDRAPREESGQTATQVCDGIITGAAADYLQDLTGQDEFAGRAERSTEPPNFENYINDLMQSTEQWKPYCSITEPGAGGTSSASIDFGWRRSIEPTEATRQSLAFNAGEFAYALDNAAYIEFHCPVGAPGGDYLVASFYANNQRAGTQHMAVANTVSRAVAEQLGCLEGANLPEGDPEVITE